MSHSGAHIRAPCHCFERHQGPAYVPLERLIDESVVLDPSQCPSNTSISVAELNAAVMVDGVRSGDIVRSFAGDAQRRAASAFDCRPRPTAEATTYLAGAGVKLVRADLDGLEGLLTPGDLARQLILLGHDVQFIEHLTDRAALSCSRVIVRAQPIPIQSLDEFPSRTVAFE